jgi:hypothetical protein
VEFSTEAPKTGPLRIGEVVVEELGSGRILRGVEGIELIWRHIPAYALLRPLLKLPAIRRYVDREVRGCNDNACGVAQKNPDDRNAS